MPWCHETFKTSRPGGKLGCEQLSFPMEIVIVAKMFVASSDDDQSLAVVILTCEFARINVFISLEGEVFRSSSPKRALD